MSDNTPLTDLAVDLHANSVNHGFWPDGPHLEGRNFGELIALMHSEYSEALDENRSGNPGIWLNEEGKPEGELTEMIDGAIRTFDALGAAMLTEEGEPQLIAVYAADKKTVLYYVNLDEAFRLKANYNAGRPPLHGRKY